MRPLIPLITAGGPAVHDTSLRPVIALVAFPSFSLTPGFAGQATPASSTAPAARLTILGDNSVAQGGVKAAWGWDAERVWRNERAFLGDP